MLYYALIDNRFQAQSTRIPSPPFKLRIPFRLSTQPRRGLPRVQVFDDQTDRRLSFGIDHICFGFDGLQNERLIGDG